MGNMFSSPTENGTPYNELSKTALLKIAERPASGEQAARDYFTHNTTSWELTRTFVDAHDDLTDWEWSGVCDLCDTAKKYGREPVRDMRRWVETKHMSEFVLWQLGCHHATPEAFDHLTAETLLEHFKKGDRIHSEEGWLIAVRKVDTRLLEVTHTEDLRTLGRVVGMSGRRYLMGELEKMFKGETVRGVRRDVDRFSELPLEHEVLQFAYGFHSAPQVNPDTLLSVLRLMRRHPSYLSEHGWLLDWLTGRDEAKNSVKIQRWLGH